jgi:hypothetical protein
MPDGRHRVIAAFVSSIDADRAAEEFNGYQTLGRHYVCGPQDEPPPVATEEEVDSDLVPDLESLEF